MKAIKNLIRSVPGSSWLIGRLRLLRGRLRTFCRLNLYKTTLVNFKFLKFSEAIQFPIYVFGKLKVRPYNGKITIQAPIKKGLILIGINIDDFSASNGSALLDLRGELIFKGECIFSIDTVTQVLEGASVNIGRFVIIGNGVKIRGYESIIIDDWVRIASECQVFDTNFHYTRNMETGEVFRKTAPVRIGDKCWIGNRTSIMKGCTLPEGCIVGSNSLLNKDYVKQGVKPYSVMVGMPAKVVGENQSRIFGILEEMKIDRFFEENPEAKIYRGIPGTENENEEEGLLYYWKLWTS